MRIVALQPQQKDEFDRQRSDYEQLAVLLDDAVADSGLVIPLDPDPDVPALVSNGKLTVMLPGMGRLTEMRAGRCHQNSAALHIADGYAVWTGYALNGGLWRQHSWCMDGQVIVETTNDREAYFGFELTGHRLELFVLNEVHGVYS